MEYDQREETYAIQVAAEQQPPPEPTRSAVADSDRLTMVLQVHHEHFGDEPHDVIASADRMLDTICEPWSRRVQVGEEAKQLPRGWVGDEGSVGMVVIENLRPRYNVNPTPEQIEDDAAKVVEVIAGDHVFLVRPGFPWPFECLEPSLINIRCQRGTTTCRITVFPR